MYISKKAIQRPVTTVMAMLIVILLGVVSVTNLKEDLYPEFSLPFAAVITNYEGAGPREIETLVTKPLESSLGTVSSLKSISSTSSAGSSLTNITVLLP